MSEQVRQQTNSKAREVAEQIASLYLAGSSSSHKQKALATAITAAIEKAVGEASERAGKAEELLKAGRHAFNDANPNGKTILDFMNCWADQDKEVIAKQAKQLETLRAENEALRRRIELAESKSRDMEPTYQFGADVMNKVVLPRLAKGEPGECDKGSARELLDLWLTERDQIKAENAELGVNEIASILNAERDGCNQLKAELERVRRERDELAKTVPLPANYSRLLDLVRYQRSELLQAELITEDEYAALLAVPMSPRRLESYDEVRAERDAALAECGRLREALSGLVEAATVEVNEKGAGGFMLARLSDAQTALSGGGKEAV